MEGLDEGRLERDMVAWAAGELRAFDRLYAALAPRLSAFFRRSFHDDATAQELLQATFLRLHAARADYRAGAPLRPWLFTIAARLRLDELRRRRRLPPAANEEEVASAEAEPAAPSPEERLDARSEAARVRTALARLPESQRVVIHLHRWEGLSFAEIAAALGTTEGAVKLRAFRGYEALRASLAPGRTP